MNYAANLMSIMPVLIVLATGMIVLLGDACSAQWRARRWYTWGFSLFGVLMALVQAGNQLQTQMATTFSETAFAGSIVTDSFTLTCYVILLITALLAILLAMTYLENRNLNLGEYYALVLFSTAGGMLMACSNDLIVLFVSVEILSVALYVLSGFARTEEKSEEAALKYFLLGAFASGFLLYGIALVYGGSATANHAGTTNLADLNLYLINDGRPSVLLMCGIALLFVGLAFKAALVPFHMWTPDVYEGAPTSVTAYMAAGAKIGAFAALMRVCSALAPIGEYWLPAVQTLAVLTMFGGNILAVVQDNVKRMLAYSSIAHAGYLLVAVSAASVRNEQAHNAAMGAMAFYLMAYAVMTMGAFGVLIYLSRKGRDLQTIEDLRGLARTDTFAAYAMLVFMLSLGGIPPTMGFMGKWFIFSATLQAGQVWLAIVMALASIISIYYYLKIVWMMCFQEPERPEVVEHAVASGGVRATIVLSLATMLVFGILPGALGILLNAAETTVFRP
ncbi:MAG: NADH-quinone oxidoreductase subunit N [Chloroherpetonaceae bacterium]|nr:NADH-quinone oxidoreductase subunit N [Chthonomonadaceae bacterium]MDW8207835.1 NADH-quinone oxidoreductase subunit N [Chloroherpetonaceae bacterium]